MIALILLATLAGIEFGMYRPNLSGLEKSEQELRDVQAQVAGAVRRQNSDRELLRLFRTDAAGDSFRLVYQSEDALTYLNELIRRSRLSRLDFQAEETTEDGIFKVERFYITLQGSYDRIFDFVKSVESGDRLARVDGFRIDPIENSTQAFIKARVSIYGLPARGTTP